LAAALACVLILFSGLGVLWGAAARATTLTNRDSKAHELTVLYVTPPKTIVLEPSHQVHDLCPTGCVVRLNGSPDDDYRLEGSELISLEDGALYYDGEQPDAQPSSAESNKIQNPKPGTAQP